MERGFVKIWRKSNDTDIMKNHKLWVFWTWCLLKASYKDHKVIVGNQEVFLTKGQFIFGRKKAANELAMSEKNIRTLLKVLKKQEKVAIKVASKFSIISVLNWDTYQGEICKGGHQSGQQVASKWPASGHKQEGKERKEGKEDKNTCPICLNFFDSFWKEYPRKVSKPQAKKAFFKINPDQQLFEKILEGLSASKQQDSWKEKNGQFIPYPATWLNGRRWEDEIMQSNRNEGFKNVDYSKTTFAEPDWA